jgi:hypothetical protein
MSRRDDPEQLTLTAELARQGRRSVEELRASALGLDDLRPWSADVDQGEQVTTTTRATTAPNDERGDGVDLSRPPRLGNPSPPASLFVAPETIGPE